MTNYWSDDQIAILCASHRKGMSFGEIGAKLGRTRNSTIGKFDRLRREGHASALEAVANRAPQMSISDRVAEYMAEHDGCVAQCARHIGANHNTVKTAWGRIRHRMGVQSA